MQRESAKGLNLYILDNNLRSIDGQIAMELSLVFTDQQIMHSTKIKHQKMAGEPDITKRPEKPGVLNLL